MTAPALALIVPTRSIVPSREPGSWERFTHLGGSSTVMVVTVVMVTAYCYGRSTHICPRQKGSFLAIFQYGGRKRSISPPSGCKPRFAGFAVRTRQRRPAGVSAVVCGMAGTQMVRTSVRTGFAGLHPGQTKNGQDRKLNAGAGLQPIRPLGCRNRPSSLCAPSDASDTGCRNFP